MKKNKKKTRQRYATPKIIDTFSEEELLKKVTGFQQRRWVNWWNKPGWDNSPTWDIMSP